MPLLWQPVGRCGSITEQTPERGGISSSSEQTGFLLTNPTAPCPKPIRDKPHQSQRPLGATQRVKQETWGALPWGMGSSWPGRSTTETLRDPQSKTLKLTAAVLGPVELCEGLPSISTRFAGEWDFCPCLGEGI